MEIPNFREAFENDLTRIYANLAKTKTNIVLGDIQNEAVKYSYIMCTELDKQSGGLLTYKMTIDITNQVCDVVDMFFPVFKNSKNMRALTIKQTTSKIEKYLEEK